MKTKIILWIGALLLLTAGARCEKNTEKPDTRKAEAIIDYANPATDGCGWLVLINNKPYFPVNLADEYKIDKLKVSVDYQLLDSKYTCWPGTLIPEIKIITIKKLK